MKQNLLQKIASFALIASLALNPAFAADSTIAGLPNGTSVQTGDQTAITRSGTTYRVPLGTAAAQPTNAFIANGGTAGGDLGGTYPNPTVLKINGSTPAASATTDTTNAANISSGTLPAARLPNPSATTLGGVQSAAAVSHQFLTSITTLGAPVLAQPAASDVSGLAASATTDTTNASNIASGTLAAARGGAGTVNGILKANGSGLVSAAVSGTDFQAPLSLTTTGTSGAATLIGGTLNIPQYSGGGGGSVSITSSSPNIVLSPSTITGTGTVSFYEPLNALTGTSYTVLASDIAKTLTHTNASPIAISLPQAGTTGFGTGAAFTDVCLGNGACTITPTTSTINGAASQILHKGGFAYPISDGTNYSAAVFPGYGTITSGALMKFMDASGAATAATAGTDYQAPLALTTTGTSGPATLIGNTLNIPQYTGGGGGGGTLGTSASATSPQISGDATSGFYSDAASTVKVAAGGVPVMAWNTAASAVNYLSITPSATGVAPTITNIGSDTNGAGLGLKILGKDASAAGVGGPVTITAGTGSGSNAGGALALSAGTSGSGNFGGATTLSGGTGTGASSVGGSVTIQGGTGVGGGGSVTIQGGGGAAAQGVTIKGGAVATSATNNGTVTISGTTPTGTGPGAAATMSAGSANGSGYNGAAATINGGNGGTTGNGGAVNINAGTGGSTSGNGGDVVITPGSKTSGTNGSVKVAGGLQSAGTKFTLTGCSAGTTLGGADAGSFVSGTTGTCTVVITMNGAAGSTAPNGWTCHGSDENTGAAAVTTAHTTTTATLSVTTTSGDLVSFMCKGY